MTYVEVFESSHRLAVAAAAGPHKGWSTFEIALEGARFHQIHELLQAPEFGAAEEKAVEQLVLELESLANSVGYGAADSWLARADLNGPSDAMEADRRAMMDLFETDDYLAEVIASERKLQQAAATAEARTCVNFRLGEGGVHGPIHHRMAAAYADGRETRLAEQGRIPRSVRIAEPVAAATLDESFEGMLLQSILHHAPDEDEDSEYTTLQSARFIGQGRIEGIGLHDLAEFVEEARLSDTETATLLLPAFEAELARASSDRQHIATINLEAHGVTLTMLLRDALRTHPDGLGVHSFTVYEWKRAYDPAGAGVVGHRVTAEGIEALDVGGWSPDHDEETAPEHRGLR